MHGDVPELGEHVTVLPSVCNDGSKLPECASAVTHSCRGVSLEFLIMSAISDKQCSVSLVKSTGVDEAYILVNPVTGLSKTLPGKWKLSFNDQGWGILHNESDGKKSWVKEHLPGKVAAELPTKEKMVIDVATKEKVSISELNSKFEGSYAEIPWLDKHPSGAHHFTIKIYKAS
eukprot:4049657-Lingulodinium_polyedra.AAC.1